MSNKLQADVLLLIFGPHFQLQEPGSHSLVKRQPVQVGAAESVLQP
jgi:hypothetical protein